MHFCVYACLHVLDFIKEKEGRNEVNRVPEFKFFSFWESVACGHQYFLIAPEAQNATADFSSKEQSIFGFKSRKGERQFRQKYLNTEIKCRVKLSLGSLLGSFLFLS